MPMGLAPQATGSSNTPAGCAMAGKGVIEDQSPGPNAQDHPTGPQSLRAGGNGGNVMSPRLLRNRSVLILGLVIALGLVASRKASGDAPGITPDGTRIAPAPTPNPAPPSTNTKQASGELDPSFAGDGTTWSYLPGYNGGSFVQDEAEAVAIDVVGGI